MTEPHGGNTGQGGATSGMDPGTQTRAPFTIGPTQFEGLRRRFKERLAVDGDQYLVLMLIARGWTLAQTQDFLGISAHRVQQIVDNWPTLQNNL